MRAAADRSSLRVCAALLLCTALAGCAKPAESPAPPCADVVSAVQASQTFEELTELSKDKLAAFLDLDPGLLADQAMAIDASRASAECVVALTAVDASALPALQTALRDYRDRTLDEYRDYRPEELPKLERALLQTHALQTILIVAPDAAPAEAALGRAWKGLPGK